MLQLFSGFFDGPGAKITEYAGMLLVAGSVSIVRPFCSHSAIVRRSAIGKCGTSKQKTFFRGQNQLDSAKFFLPTTLVLNGKGMIDYDRSINLQHGGCRQPIYPIIGLNKSRKIFSTYLFSAAIKLIHCHSCTVSVKAPAAVLGFGALKEPFSAGI